MVRRPFFAQNAGYGADSRRAAGSSREDLTTMRRTVLAAIFSGLLCLTGGGVAAQSTDVRPLLDRLDRLERDMNLLQRQVYRSPAGAVPPSPSDAVNYEVRIGQIEDQQRALTGQIEEINNNIDQIKRRLEALTNDIEQRFAALEHGGAPQAQLTPQPIGRARGAGDNPAEAASQVGTLGQAPGAKGAGQTATAPADSGALPSGSPQEQYNYAFGLLRQAKYDAAEQALRSFVQRYPNDALAGNAQFWLGETYYVRKDYGNAAAVFAEGYQKYSKSGKAADTLMKLGMSLSQLGRKPDACGAFARLDRDFPSASAEVMARASDEKKRLGC
jgi:tol-pal system protein YbgF